MEKLRHLYRRRPAWLNDGCSVFLGTLLLRLVVVLRATAARDFLPDHGDMGFYDHWARKIAAGVWTDHHAFYGMPLYAYGVAGLYRVVGYFPFVVVLLQNIAEAATALWLYKIATVVFVGDGRARQTIPERDASAPVHTRVIGLAAAAGWACFVPAQAFACIMMPTAFLVCAFWYLVWWCVRTRVQPRALRPWVCFALGAFVGVTAMLVANILFLIPLLLAAILLPSSALFSDPTSGEAAGAAPGRRRSFPRALAGCILLLAGIGCGTAPCWLHNYFVAHDPVLLSAHSGLNFWIGNNPEANGYPNIPPGLHADQQGMLLDSITWAERAAGRPLTRAEVSAFWSAKAQAYIVAHPGDWLRLLGVKLGNFWSGFQYDDLSIITSLREDGALLPGLSFGVVAALSLPGLGLAAWRRPAARWIIAAVLLHMASLLPVFITERYRLAAVPGLLLLAAYGLGEFARAVRARRYQWCAGFALALTGAFLLVQWPQGDASLRLLDDYNTGIADTEAGHLDRAQAKLERVLAANPNNAENQFALGNLWLARGDRQRAKNFYRRTLQLDPAHNRALNNLGVLAMQENRWPLAEQFLTAALHIEPDDSNVLYLLAQTQWHHGNRAQAQAAIAQALALKPQQARLLQLREQIQTSEAPTDFHSN